MDCWRCGFGRRHSRAGSEAPAGAPAATATVATTTPPATTSAPSAPGVGPRWRVSPASEVGIGAPLRSLIVVTHGAIDHRALDGAREDAADDLPEDLAAVAAKSAAGIVVAVDARAIARAFKLAAAARHL